MAADIDLVLRMGAVRKVLHSVVRRITVQVAHLQAFWPGPDVRLGYQGVHRVGVAPDRDGWIPARTRPGRLAPDLRPLRPYPSVASNVIPGEFLDLSHGYKYSKNLVTPKVVVMTESEFNAFMRSLPREKSQAEVDQVEHQHDLEVGEWVNPHLAPHVYGESGH